MHIRIKSIDEEKKGLMNKAVKRKLMKQSKIKKILVWHVFRMHFSTFEEAPSHSFPPFTGFGASHFLDLDFVPMSHDFEHVLHGDQLPHEPSNGSSVIKFIFLLVTVFLS